nr:NADH dehydrogenase subunit 6 [Ixodes angustus]
MLFFMMTFFMFNHPMLMLFSIIMITIIMAFKTMMYMKMMWISLILILLVLGGMLILFLYIISLIPNKKIFMNKKLILLLITMFISMKNFSINESPFIMINSLFSHSSMNLIIFMMIYLLISLMIVMKIMTSSNSPLKLYN